MRKSSLYYGSYQKSTSAEIPKYWFLFALIGVVVLFLFYATTVFKADDSGGQEVLINLDQASFMPGLGLNKEKVENKRVKKEQRNEAPELPRELEASNQTERYIERFKHIALREEEKFGIPAGITLAQGILESQTGTSRLVREANNHFGIKCFSRKCEQGHCINFSDDHHKDFFVVFPSAWDSYRAHSLLISGDRYRHLKNLGNEDYISWAKGLYQAGYATDKRYAEKLISVIQRYQLGKIGVEY
jgi:flagellum-specific peptidoglycan hydrolase FlgJ